MSDSAATLGDGGVGTPRPEVGRHSSPDPGRPSPSAAMVGRTCAKCGQFYEEPEGQDGGCPHCARSTAMDCPRCGTLGAANVTHVCIEGHWSRDTTEPRDEDRPAPPPPAPTAAKPRNIRLYEKRPERYEAIQFLGTGESCSEVSDFLGGPHSGNCEWNHSTTTGGRVKSGTWGSPLTGRQSWEVFGPGDWLVKIGEVEYRVMSDEQFRERFEVEA